MPGPNGAPDVPIRIVRMSDGPSPAPAVLWFHGGGYVMGGHELETRRLERLVLSAGCTAIAVGYRLSPETPYPGPLDDCFAALSHIVANAASFQVDTDRIAVGGESAGGPASPPVWRFSPGSVGCASSTSIYSCRCLTTG